MGRMSHEELDLEFRGLGYFPIIVDNELEEDIYVQMTNAMDTAYAMINDINVVPVAVKMWLSLNGQWF